MSIFLKFVFASSILNPHQTQCSEQQEIQGTEGDTKGEQNAQETKSTGASSHHL